MLILINSVNTRGYCIIEDDERGEWTLISGGKMIARITVVGRYATTLDKKYWDYSRTIRKYRNLFLEESTRETRRKLTNGEYTLRNLNEGGN